LSEAKKTLETLSVSTKAYGKTAIVNVAYIESAEYIYIDGEWEYDDCTADVEEFKCETIEEEIDDIERGGVTFKNVSAFASWVKKTVKSYYSNIEDYLDELDKQYMTSGFASYEIKGRETKSGLPETYRYEVNDIFEDEEYIGREYVL
jgi:hypothetical protein